MEAHIETSMPVIRQCTLAPWRAGVAAAILAGLSLMAAPTVAHDMLDMALDPWNAINDGVMGGISLGEMVAIPDGLRFQGDISLENSGGFASVRRPIDGKLANLSGIRMRVRGDGRRYQLRIRLDNNADGISWRELFDTDGAWQTVDLPIENFEPVFRGRTITGADALDTSRIRQLGFLLADGQQGPFQLDITSIRFLYRRNETSR